MRWVYTHAGMPVEVTAEFENWRRIRDWEGAEGWVYHSLLSGKRTATVVPKTKDELVPLFEKANLESPIVARLQPGVLGALKSCSGNWCQFSGKGFDGFVRQDGSGAPTRMRKWTRRVHSKHKSRRRAGHERENLRICAISPCVAGARPRRRV